MKVFFTLLLFTASLYAIAAPPTVSSSNLSFYSIDGNYFNLGWSGGNGARRLMVAKIGSEPTFVPQDKVSYTANTEFGLGQQVAPGEYIVYDHNSFSYFLTGLTPSTHYYFRMYEYNGTGNTTEYLTTSYLTGNGWTSTIPTVQTSGASFTNITSNSATISWTSGNGQRRLIIAKEGSAVDAEPEVNKPYSSASSNFGSGANLGGGNYAVYWSSSNFFTLHNLKGGTEYHLAFYEFNGNQYPQYLRPSYTSHFTTRSVPTTAASNLVITKADGKELTLDWTNGDGQRRIVVARKGSSVTSTPVDGTGYTANTVFGQGQQLSPGEYVIYSDNFHSTTVSGLEPGSTYFFKVFEYDGTGSSSAYLTSSFAAVSGTTATTPTIQSQFLAATNVSSNALRLNFSPGNGRARMIVGRIEGTPLVAPADFTEYTYDGIFGTGQDLGGGNYVLSYTNGSWINVTGLQPNTTYQFAVYEYNGYNQPLYLAPAATNSVTTSTALPVKLSHWEAAVSGKTVSLQWKTSSESNTSLFVVERSADGQVFTAIGNVQASGNSTGEKSYHYSDQSPLPTQGYYRLKMVDLDNHVEYSPVRSVSLTGEELIKIAANPVQSRLQVSSTLRQETEWRIVSTAGQVMAKGRLVPGQNNLNVANLPSGQYWLQANNAQTLKTIAFTKQ